MLDESLEHAAVRFLEKEREVLVKEEPLVLAVEAADPRTAEAAHGLAVPRAAVVVRARE